MPDIAGLGCTAALLLAAAALSAVASAPPVTGCVPAGTWAVPAGSRDTAHEVLSRAAREQVVLIGEEHDNADHHRWQLQAISTLAALRPNLVLGFEMFPRRVQPALDRWVAGELNEAEFLAASDWVHVWGYEPALYLPLFHFARLNRIPMVALNVEREFVRAVGAKGLEAVPADKREGVTAPAPASPAYIRSLLIAYAEHPEKGSTATPEDPAFRRFVDAQLVWDRAMAQALVDAASKHPGALLVGVMGSSHVADGHGVPHQLRSLGVQRIASLLPWAADADCAKLVPGYASAVFGFPPALRAPPVPPRPLLGISIEGVPEGVKVLTVNSGSIAEAAGLKSGDILIEAAGSAVRAPADIRARVLAMAPGTLLPIRILREGATLELIAKFPPAQK